MKKLILIVMLLLAAMAVLPASAQDEEAEPISCSPEEFNDATAEISQGINEFLESLSSEEQMDAAALTEIVVALDGFSTGFWEGYNEAAEEELCIEMVWYGFNAGLIIDDLLITSQLNAIALHEAEAGNSENAETFAALAQTRGEILQTNASVFNENVGAVAEGGTLSVEFIECSEEELEATDAALEEIANAYLEIADMSGEGEEDYDFAALTAGYASLSNGFWTELMATVPACTDAQFTAFAAGLLIDESVIASGLYYLAEAESALGNEETAGVLLESADARAENVMASLEEMDASEEE